MNQEIKRGRGFFLGSLCTAHRSGSQLIPHLRQTNINIWIFHFLQTHKSHNMAVIILTYSIIIYAFLHLANALIISDLSSLTSPFRLSLSVCVCVRETLIQCKFITATFPWINTEILPAMFRDPANTFRTGTFTHRYLLNLVAGVCLYNPIWTSSQSPAEN